MDRDVPPVSQILLQSMEDFRAETKTFEATSSADCADPFSSTGLGIFEGKTVAKQFFL